MADTMLSFRDNSLSEFMTMDQVKAACPMAFKEAPTNPGVSKKYTMATTVTVMEDLEKLGWQPVQAKQCRAKKNSAGIRSFHMIAFQNPNVKILKPSKDGTEIVDSYPRIILTNSHDGFNSFKFMVGLFRCVCSNGLIVSDGELANMTIRHINYDFECLRQVVAQTIERIPNIVCTMNTMRNTVLSEDAKKELATEVVKIRKNVAEDEQFNVDEETLRDILMPNRDEDNSDDLWTVFNVCQEKMIRGGFVALGSKNKVRKQRGITSIKKDADFNQRLWAAALKYLPQEAVATA